MENRERRNRKGDNGRGLLYVIMIVFCMLAMIEIIYGRVQLNSAREQLASEQEKNQKMQELIDESAKHSQSDMVMQEDTTEEDAEEEEQDNTTTGEAEPDAASQDTAEGEPEEAVWVEKEEENKEYDMQIVFMGDSILDNVREYDGIAYLVSEECNAKVYNMAMGGTTAALLPGEQNSFDDWSSRSLVGVVNAILGNISSDIFKDYHAGEVLEECDFSKTDYFVIEYGVNDFLSKIPDSRYLEDGSERDIDAEHTYVGALEMAVKNLHKAFPDAKIMLVSPHYCQFFSGDTFIGDAYSIDYGYGNLVSYADLCSYVYEQYKRDSVMFFNTIESSGINAYTADNYLEDGIHLTSEGRRIYADYIARRLNVDFRPAE